MDIVYRGMVDGNERLLPGGYLTMKPGPIRITGWWLGTTVRLMADQWLEPVGSAWLVGMTIVRDEVSVQ